VNLSILIASRSADRFAIALAVLSPVAGVLSHRGLKIDLTQQYAPAVMAVPELVAVLAACLGVLVLRPQLWVVDRLGVPSRRWIPSVAAVVAGALGPQLILVVAVLVALPPAQFTRCAANVLALTALAYLVSPFVGAFGSSGLILMLYFALTCAQQMEPAIGDWSPLVISTGGGGRWVVAVATTAVALVVTVRTLGRTRLTWGPDLDLA
jgi:hypothetical protein